MRKIYLTESQFKDYLHEMYRIMSQYNDPTTKLEEYRKLARAFSHNAVAMILYKLKASIPTTRLKKDTSFENDTVWNDNTIKVVYKASLKNFSVFFNGVKCYTGKIGEDTLFKALIGILDADVNGSITIKRPEGRTFAKDKRELSPKNMAKAGVTLSGRIEQVLKRYGNIVKQGGSNKPILTSDEYEYFTRSGVINPENFMFNEYNKIYINKTHPRTYIAKDSDLDDNGASLRNFILNAMYNRRESCIIDSEGSIYVAGHGRIYEYCRGERYDITADVKTY